MKVNIIRLVTICNLVILIVGNSSAQDKSGQITAKKEKISYLRDIAENLSEGVEKEFLLALEKQKSERFDLIEALNLFQKKDLRPIGTIQFPGQKIEPLYIDWGGTWARTNRPKLRWENSIITSNDSFRLLFFQVVPPSSIRPTCDAIIVTTDTNYKIRFWTKAGCYQDFIKASIEKAEDGFIFKVFSKLDHSENDLRIHQYKITLNKLVEFQNVK